MRNSPATESQLRDMILNRLSESMPWTWEAENSLAQKRGTKWPETDVDGWFLVRSQGIQARLAVEIRLSFEPRDVERLWQPSAFTRPPNSPERVADANNRIDGCLLVAPYLTPRAQELLETAGWNYADATGNVRIAIERPALFVRLTGEARNPFRETRPLRTLKGPAAGRLVRALADFRPPYGVVEIAARAGSSAAMASRVVAMLEADAIVTRERRGPITRVDWKALIERWTEEYSFVRSNRVGRYLALRGRKPLLEKLRQTKLDYAITGAMAAERRKTVAPAVVATIYSTDPESLARECDLEPATRTADVLIAEPYDPVAMERTWDEEGLRYVALTQVVADLFTSGDRNPQIAIALLEWMETHQDAWRT